MTPPDPLFQNSSGPGDGGSGSHGLWLGAAFATPTVTDGGGAERTGATGCAKLAHSLDDGQHCLTIRLDFDIELGLADSSGGDGRLDF